MMLALIAALLLILGSVAAYLAAPHQQLRKTAAPRGLGLLGAAAILAALVILLTIMGSATAVFTAVIGLMLLWSILPVAIAWIRYRQSGKSQ